MCTRFNKNETNKWNREDGNTVSIFNDTNIQQSAAINFPLFFLFILLFFRGVLVPSIIETMIIHAALRNKRRIVFFRTPLSSTLRVPVCRGKQKKASMNLFRIIDKQYTIASLARTTRYDGAHSMGNRNFCDDHLYRRYNITHTNMGHTAPS